jgi:hypothetical protein
MSMGSVIGRSRVEADAWVSSDSFIVRSFQTTEGQVRDAPVADELVHLVRLISS